MGVRIPLLKDERSRHLDSKPAGDGCARGPARWGSAALALVVALTALAVGRRGAAADDKKLYVVSLAHLDTQWRWTIQDTIRSYIPNTMRGQVELMDLYPGYVFSFEGAFRHMLMKEYFPSDYEKVQPLVASGQWAVAGASIDAGDPNMPSPESAIRHILYGNQCFEREFGKRAYDVLLPDSFGFPATLPTVAAHCGLKGFSTQKLAWGGGGRYPSRSISGSGKASMGLPSWRRSSRAPTPPRLSRT